MCCSLRERSRLEPAKSWQKRFVCDTPEKEFFQCLTEGHFQFYSAGAAVGKDMLLLMDRQRMGETALYSLPDVQCFGFAVLWVVLCGEKRSKPPRRQNRCMLTLLKTKRRLVQNGVMAHRLTGLVRHTAEGFVRNADRDVGHPNNQVLQALARRAGAQSVFLRFF